MRSRRDVYKRQARRYCVVGLLISLFACVMLKADLPLFLFFFLSAMLNTWLVIRAQSRQDVVIGIIPLALGQIIIALGSGWLEGFRGGNTFLWLFGIVSLNAFISISILFAISPIIEMSFRYTTPVSYTHLAPVSPRKDGGAVRS